MGFALAFGFIVAFSFVIYNGFDDAIQSQPNSTIPQIVKDVSTSSRTNFPPLWDYLFVFILLAFVTFSVIAARLIPSSPKFILITIFTLILMPFIAMFFENIWSGFLQQSAIATALSSMIFMPYILDHLVVVVVIYATLVALALLTKEDNAG